MKPHNWNKRCRWALWRKNVRGKNIRGRYWRRRYNRMSGHAKHWFWHD